MQQNQNLEVIDEDNKRWNRIMWTLVLSTVFPTVGISYSVYDGYRQYPLYQNYVENAQPFLRNASNAGTNNVAGEELEKAWVWVEKNYPQDSFEYLELRADLAFLKRQEPFTAVPQIVRESLETTVDRIDTTASENSFESVFDQVMTIFILWLVLYLILCACLTSTNS